MKTSEGPCRWRPLLGATVWGVLARGLALQAAPKARSPQAEKVSGQTRTMGLMSEGKIRIGPGVPADIPVFPPVVVDYRDDPTSRAIAAGEQVPVWGREIRRTSDQGGVAANPGDPCRLNAECNDCNACTVDDCATDVCTGGVRDGFSCAGDDDCWACVTAAARPEDIASVTWTAVT